MNTPVSPTDDIRYMKMALDEASLAFDQGEVPVGAVVVCRGRVIARAHNLTETLTDVTAHAEMQAITAAANYLGGKCLNECTLYVPVEPCIMCAGAIVQSRIKKVYFGARDEKYGAVTSVINTFDVPSNHKVVFEEGIKQEECTKIIKDFFKKLREKKKDS